MHVLNPDVEYTDNIKKGIYTGESRPDVLVRRPNYVPYSIEDTGIRGIAYLIDTRTEVRSLDLDLFSQFIAEKFREKEEIIHGLQVKLSEFERKRSFAPRRRKLPSDYYENPAYLDE
jgi:hypothetical protein